MAKALTTDAAKHAEVERILACKPSDQFGILGLSFDANPDMTADDVKKRYRELSLIHPDRCDHPNAKDAFHLLDKAAKMLRDEGVFNRFKLAWQRSQDQSTRASGIGPRSGGGGGSVDDPVVAAAKREREEKYMEAVRLAREKDMKKQRAAQEKQHTAAATAMLDEQQAGWNNVKKLFGAAATRTGSAAFKKKA